MRKSLAKLTIFLGSFLVFGVQPMVGRTLLPVFGGTAAVWVVCLCAFQVLLLGGYFYAHVSRHHALHVLLLFAAAALTAVIGFNRESVATCVSTGLPALDALLCVVLLVGFAYVLLSANSSLVQAITGGEDVYRLYSVSNLGSLLGLLAYPFVFEPAVALTVQWVGFAAGIAVYACLLALLMRSAGSRVEPAVPREAGDRAGAESGGQALLWLVLPAASCFLLNALTTHVTLDVMPMPLIWTLTLAIFLVSYILGFSGRAEKLIGPFGVLALVFLVGLGWMCGKPIAKVTLPVALVIFCGFLLTACTFLHSWLYAIRPGAARLTKYYLLQSVGGAVGGAVASLAFPFLAKTVAEYPVSLVLVAALVLAKPARPLKLVKPVEFALIAAAAALWFFGAKGETRPAVYRGRGFFGTIEVLEAKARTAKGEGRIHEFVHGSTVHGIQALIPGKDRMPTVYYTPNACGYGIVAHPKYRSGEPMRVNVLGLGIGVQFSYGRKGDYYRAYEISADALAVATNTNLFTFVSDCPATKELVLGDARKGLEAELAAGVEPYDVILVDAFTGDNLPYHLSTVEAFDLYFKMLKPDGVICVNISNWHLALEPFMRAIGDHYGCPMLGLVTRDDYGVLQFAAKACCFCRQPAGLAPPPYGPNPGQAYPIDFSRVRPMASLPTDEKGSFISLIKW